MKLLITSSYCKSKSHENSVQRLYHACRLVHAVTAQRSGLPVENHVKETPNNMFFKTPHAAALQPSLAIILIVQEYTITADGSLAETCRILNKHFMTSTLNWSYYLDL